jgi:site-specific DNA-methyltransferase (adenine-specific)
VIPAIEVGGARVFAGDCREVLKGLPDNSVDSVVTDPPYELGFMGKKWDSSGIAYDVTVWQECLRVLKPGGHILAFGGSRTWHRLAVAVEDAGFEIRDNIAWIYGSGFPKSLDVSKAIDKTNGEGGRRYKFTAWMRTTGLTSADIDRITGTNMGGHYLTAKSQPAIPTVALWEMLRPHCGDVPAWVDELVARVEAEREVTGAHKASAPHQVWMQNYSDHTALPPKEKRDKSATAEAQKWEGWGTALKPAHEPIVVGRKALTGTVAENVLLWGVGGLNIDGSRIGTDSTGWNGLTSDRSGSAWDGSGLKGADGIQRESLGRWPANVIFDEVTAGLLDKQTGVLKSGKMLPTHTTAERAVFGHNAEGGYTTSETYGDAGGASRFFYVAKASKRDRNEGLEELEAQRHADRVVDDGPGGENPRNRTNTAKQNFHPTVKPTQLMRYLIKLVTPTGGTVLDPFTGSGSTGKAALLDGFGFVGVELTKEYLPIIEGRLRWATEQGDDDDTLF